MKTKQVKQINQNKSKNKSKNKKKKIISFFDVDGTLIKTDSPYFYLKEMFKKKMVPFYVLIYFIYLSYMYSIDKFDFKKKFENRKIKFLENKYQKEIQEFCNKVFEKKVKKHISKKMIKIIKNHKQKGHAVVLLTNSPKEIIKPLKEYIGADDMLTSILEVKNNKFTGYFSKILFREEKFKEAIKYCKKKNTDIKHSYFYTDSYNDDPLMIKVKHPVAVSPDKKLKKEAIEKGWKIIYLEN